MWSKTGIITTLSAALLCTTLQAQDTVHYSGNTLSYVTEHHGRLPLAMGVHNIQVLRASREDASAKNGFGWTYNHAPMLAYWNNTFYLEYLSNPVGEHVPPGRTLLTTSKDGRTWSDPVVIFPEYKVPDGFKKEGREGVAHDLYAVMHQRMGFYTASNKKLLALAFYGIAMDQKDDPNDGNGIGRVVREIKADGSYGPIHFIRYNHSFNEQNSSFPFYKKSKDKAFVAACDELLSKPLMMQQWNEEADRNDPLIPLKKDFKAFNFYHLPDGQAVGLWKHALTSITKDEGKTWQYNPLRAPGFVNSNAKIWGQRTQDGKYATVYNPSEFRWPLALSVSNDGLNYTNLLLVNGEITPMRYGGNYKSYGPQYVRGIQEGDGVPPDGNLWVTYSMNKEDIWVSVIPVPVKDKATTSVNDVFAQMKAGAELNEWNIFSPVYAPVSVSSMSNGVKALTLKDSDPFDYAKAERLFPASRKMTIEFEVVPMQIKGSNLQIEVQDAQGTPGLRLVLEADSIIKAKVGARFKRIAPYEAGKPLAIRLDLTLATRMYTVTVNGKPAGGATLFYQPLAAMERIVFRTGDTRHFPIEDTPADNFEDMKGTGEKIPEAVYHITYLKTFAE